MLCHLERLVTSPSAEPAGSNGEPRHVDGGALPGVGDRRVTLYRYVGPDGSLRENGRRVLEE